MTTPKRKQHLSGGDWNCSNCGQTVRVNPKLSHGMSPTCRDCVVSSLGKAATPSGWHPDGCIAVFDSKQQISSCKGRKTFAAAMVTLKRSCWNCGNYRTEPGNYPISPPSNPSCKLCQEECTSRSLAWNEWLPLSPYWHPKGSIPARDGVRV